VEKLTKEESIKIGNLLKKARINSKKTTREVATNLGYSQGHVSGIENGNRKIPSVNYIIDSLNYLTNSYDEYSFYVDEINKINRDKIQISKREENTDDQQTLFGPFEINDSPNVFKYTDYDGFTFTRVEEFPINDFKFHLNDVMNNKYYRKLPLNDYDIKYIDNMINQYLINKYEIMSLQLDDFHNHNAIDEKLYKNHKNNFKEYIEKLKNPNELKY